MARWRAGWRLQLQAHGRSAASMATVTSGSRSMPLSAPRAPLSCHVELVGLLQVMQDHCLVAQTHRRRMAVNSACTHIQLGLLTTSHTPASPLLLVRCRWRHHPVPCAAHDQSGAPPPRSSRSRPPPLLAANPGRLPGSPGCRLLPPRQVLVVVTACSRAASYTQLYLFISIQLSSEDWLNSFSSLSSTESLVHTP